MLGQLERNPALMYTDMKYFDEVVLINIFLDYNYYSTFIFKPFRDFIVDEVNKNKMDNLY